MTDFYVNRRNGSPRNRGASGFDFTDSHGRVTRYDADRNGRIVVDNPEHIRTLEQAAQNDGGYIQKGTGMSQSRTPSKHCHACRFLAYRWQTACPKCGGELELGEQ